MTLERGGDLRNWVSGMAKPFEFSSFRGYVFVLFPQELVQRFSVWEQFQGLSLSILGIPESQILGPGVPYTNSLGTLGPKDTPEIKEITKIDRF